MAKFKALDPVRASDLDVHHAAVELAGEAGDGAKALNKLLDQRHELVVRRFKSAADPQALVALNADMAKESHDFQLKPSIVKASFAMFARQIRF